jgi:hypothetical protein
MPQKFHDRDRNDMPFAPLAWPKSDTALDEVRTALLLEQLGPRSVI